MKFHKALLVAAFILLSGSAASALQSPDTHIKPTMAEPGSIALCVGGVASIWIARKKARSKK
jgi:hypothetical protein